MHWSSNKAVLYTSDAGDLTSLSICFSLCTLELGEVKLEASILFTSQNGEGVRYQSFHCYSSIIKMLF